VAQRLNRRWIGIDITHLAVTLIKHRLHSAFGGAVSYTVIGEPVSLPDAEALAQQDPNQFQWRALGVCGGLLGRDFRGGDTKRPDVPSSRLVAPPIDIGRLNVVFFRISS